MATRFQDDVIFGFSFPKVGFSPSQHLEAEKTSLYSPPRIAFFLQGKIPAMFKLSKILGTKKNIWNNHLVSNSNDGKLSFWIGRNAYLPSTASNKSGKIWDDWTGKKCVLVAYEGSKKTNLKSAVFWCRTFLRKNWFTLNQLPGSLRAPENRRDCKRKVLSFTHWFSGTMWVSPVVITGFLTISRITPPPPKINMSPKTGHFIFQALIFRGHVGFQGGMLNFGGCFLVLVVSNMLFNEAYRWWVGSTATRFQPP